MSKMDNRTGKKIEWNLLNDETRNSTSISEFKCKLIAMIRTEKNSIYSLLNIFKNPVQLSLQPYPVVGVGSPLSLLRSSALCDGAAMAPCVTGKREGQCG